MTHETRGAGSQAKLIPSITESWSARAATFCSPMVEPLLQVSHIIMDSSSTLWWNSNSCLASIHLPSGGGGSCETMP